MRKEHLLISLVGLLIGFLMVFGGTALFLTTYIPALELAFKSLVLRHLTGLSYLGLTSMICGALFLTALAYLSRRRYILFQMGGAAIEDRLLSHFAKESLQRFFPDSPVACEVLASPRGKIEILASIPFIPDQNRDHVLSEIERVLILTLRKQCEYDKDFIFNVSYL